MAKKSIIILMVVCVAIAGVAVTGIYTAKDKNQKQNTDELTSPSNKADNDPNGVYVCETNICSLSVSNSADNKYTVRVDISDSVSIDDFSGEFENDEVLILDGTDPEGYPISAELSFSGEESRLTFTDSTCKDIGNGTELIFNKSIEAVLNMIKNEMYLNTAGASLKATRLAVNLLEWGYTTNSSEEEIRGATDEWMENLSEEEKSFFIEQLKEVDTKCGELLDGNANGELEAIGLDYTDYAWDNGKGAAVEAIMEASGVR